MTRTVHHNFINTYHFFPYISHIFPIYFQSRSLTFNFHNKHKGCVFFYVMTDSTEDEFSLPSTLDPSDPSVVSVGDGFVPSRCEIVSSFIDATITQSPEEREAIQRLQYGDLPREAWNDRPDQEKHWVSGKLVLPEVYSEKLKDPTSCMVIGTNGTIAIALRANNWSEPHTDSYKDPNEWPEGLTEMRTDMTKAAHLNPIFAHKMALGDFEIEAFKRSLQYEVNARITSKKTCTPDDQSLDGSGKDRSRAEACNRSDWSNHHHQIQQHGGRK